jgi:uncharacterized LabA/DUF88 family protein
MKPKRNNFAYIDGANLHKGVSVFSWKFDYKKFRVWLREKYDVEQAYVFLGYVPEYKELYTRLQKYGYILIFKEVVYDREGKIKGNCDVDVAVNMMKDSFEKAFDNAILVSSDGDYASLVKYLMEKEKLEAILSPHTVRKCSVLLRRTGARIVFLEEKANALRV